MKLTNETQIISSCWLHPHIWPHSLTISDNKSHVFSHFNLSLQCSFSGFAQYLPTANIMMNFYRLHGTFYSFTISNLASTYFTRTRWHVKSSRIHHHLDLLKFPYMRYISHFKCQVPLLSSRISHLQERACKMTEFSSSDKKLHQKFDLNPRKQIQFAELHYRSINRFFIWTNFILWHFPCFFTWP